LIKEIDNYMKKTLAFMLGGGTRRPAGWSFKGSL
jgi:hypothetical protein